MDQINVLWTKVYTLTAPYTVLQIYEMTKGGYQMTLNGVLIQHEFKCTLEEAKSCAEEIIFTEYLRVIQTIRKKYEKENSDSKDDSTIPFRSEVQPEGGSLPKADGGDGEPGVLHPSCDGTCTPSKHGEKSES